MTASSQMRCVNNQTPLVGVTHSYAPETYCIEGAAIGRKPEAGPQHGEVLKEACYTLNCVDQHAVAVAFDTYNQTVSGDTTQILCSRGDTPGGNAHLVPAVMQPVAIRTAQTSSNGWGINTEGTAYTLDQAQGQAVAFHPTQDPISSTEVCHAIGTGNGQGCATAAVLAPTLTASNDPSRSPQSSEVTAQVAAVVQATAAVAFGVGESPDLGHCLRSGASKADKHESTTYALHAMQVRRLTPVECERLQGFPDGYTAIPWRNKPATDCPDGPRYKVLGNSWAVPVVRWIGKRIADAVA